MEHHYDYKKFAIVYVDDEERSLKYFHRAFAKKFRVITASNAREAFEILRTHQDEVGVLLTDERMPEEKGVQLLEKARQLKPQIIRVLVTAYTDINAAIEAINRGAIYKYISKPWDVGHLEVTLRQALEFFIVQRERDLLLTEKMVSLRNLMIQDRVVSLGLLAAGFGHHIRNSLVAVRTFLDLAPTKLREEKTDLETLRNPNFWMEFYAHVQGQVRRITELLDNLGGLAASGAPGFAESINLPQVISEVLALLQPRVEEKKLVIKNQLPVVMPEIRGNPEQFYRLFELLLTDEIDYLPKAGRITIRGQTVASATDSPLDLLIEIEDNGPGLPEEAMRAVFDPFFLRYDNPQEFGIKLMTCFFIVYHHGGRIEVQSKPGEGTRFLIYLPISPQPPNRRLDEGHFVSKVLLNEQLWRKLLSGPS